MLRSPLYADPYTPSSPSAPSVAGSSLLEEVPLLLVTALTQLFGSRNPAPGHFFSSYLRMGKLQTCIVGRGRA